MNSDARTRGRGSGAALSVPGAMLSQMAQGGASGLARHQELQEVRP
jgi:hypothetical protein